MKNCTRWMLFLGNAVLFVSLGIPATASAPNVVLIVTDNHGAWASRCYWNREIRTPNIDRLAQ